MSTKQVGTGKHGDHGRTKEHNSKETFKQESQAQQGKIQKKPEPPRTSKEG